MMEGGRCNRTTGLGWRGRKGGREGGDRSNVAPTDVGHIIASSAICPSPGQPRFRRAAAGAGGRSSYTPDPRRNVSEETADPRLTEGETAGVEESIFAEGREGATVFRLSAI